MLPQQKEATFTLLCSVFFTVLLSALVPLVGSNKSEFILLLFLLFIGSLWLIRRLTKLKFRELDEMERNIRLQAIVIATHLMGAGIVLYGIGLYLADKAGLQIAIYMVLQMAMYSWLMLYLSWSGSILVLYKKGALNV